MSPGKKRKIDRKKKAKLLSKPVGQVKLDKGTTVADLVEQFASSSIQARKLGRAAQIYRRMLEDKDEPVIFLGLAGPLIAAGQRRIIADLIKRNYVDVVVSTGAILYQDMYQAFGGQHYEGHPDMDDVELEKMDVDRIYDTLVDDELFVEFDNFTRDFAGALEPGIYSSKRFLRELAGQIEDPDSILKACWDKDVPMFSPALNDSSLGIGLTAHYVKVKDPMKRVVLDSVMDNVEITEIICGAKATSAVYIGGGTPKNFVNDAIVMAHVDFGARVSGHKYAIQLTMAQPTDGGLSGSTLSEAKSWGKIDHEASISLAHVEASIGLPLLAGYVLGKGKRRRAKRLERMFKDGAITLKQR
jgi:deoxyhypusine synthase